MTVDNHNWIWHDTKTVGCMECKVVFRCITGFKYGTITFTYDCEEFGIRNCNLSNPDEPLRTCDYVWDLRSPNKVYSVALHFLML